MGATPVNPVGEILIALTSWMPFGSGEASDSSPLLYGVDPVGCWGCLQCEWVKPDNFVGAGGDADACLFKTGEDIAAELVLDFADVVRGTEERTGRVDPD